MSTSVRSLRSHDLPPEASALTPTTAGQRVAGGLLLALVVAALAGMAWAALPLLAGLWLLVVSASLLRLVAMVASRPVELACPAQRDDELPPYTLLVPLYREARVVPQLVTALSRLDYPRDLLQVLLLVEEDDTETRLALAAQHLAKPFEILLLREGAPRTKPRALSLALPQARGTLLTVYDAEDIPETDQLRKAAAILGANPQIGCLQAHLAIDNGHDGWLAALFALEYAVLFDVLMPGLTRLGFPVLLGGTSNHFRTQVLREVGGWDPWNVTEDADLGLRLARHGIRVATLPSTTREEAPARPKAWLRQRRRWMKGWMQTFLVHSRAPRGLVRQLGFAHALAALALLANGLSSAVAGLALTLVLMLDLHQGAVWRVWVGTAVLGVVAILAPLLLALQRRRLWRLWPVLWLAPARWLLLTLAAWWALGDLWWRPYHWGATRHGLGRRRLG